MTIPSIGGNGLNKFQAKVVQNVVPAEDMSVVEEISRGDDSIPSENNKPQVQEPEKKKEYSIDQFRKDYEHMVVNRILPELKEYEGERKNRLKIAIIQAVIFSIIAIFVFCSLNGRAAGDGAGLCIGLAVLIWAWLQKSFETKIKKKVMPVLMRAVPGFYWQQTPPVKHDEICSVKVIPNAKNLVNTFDDCFVGEYRKVPIAISECHYETGGKNSRTIFQGVVVKIKMNKNFDGVTIIRPRSSNNGDLKQLKLQEVKLEDPEFSKKYKVFSNDQIESRYLLTTSFMERFKSIELAFASEFAFCSFYGDSVYIAPHSGTDLFALCSLMKPVDNHEQFTVLFNEFVSILELVDYFKLDKKLGL